MMIISSLLVAIILASKAKGNQLQKYETRTRHMLLRSGTLLYETISQHVLAKKIEEHNKKNN